MYGQKQIFQCLAVVILIAVINFYRSAIRRDKEIQKILKLKREQLAKVPAVGVPEVVETLPKHISDGGQTKWTQPQCDSNECNIQLAEHPDDSILKNADVDSCDASQNAYSTANEQSNADRRQNENSEKGNDSDKKLKATESSNDESSNDQKQPQRVRSSKSTNKKKGSTRVISKTKINGSSIETTGVLTYIAVTILLVSLIKAAVDVSRHIREKRQRNNMDDNELLRRCSLQEYSILKQQQQHQQQQQNNNCKRKSVTKIAELGPQSSVDSGCNNLKFKEQSRRMSTNPQDYLNGSGIITEPGSPAKPGKLLAGRPAPLLRRCSVPVFGKNPSAKLAPRRPSMDSVSEDDNSSPDVKRRVRMINRH